MSGEIVQRPQASQRMSVILQGQPDAVMEERRRRSLKQRVIASPRLTLRSLSEEVGLIWQYRDLLYTLTLHRIRVRYKQSVLGIAWAVIQPLALMMIYTVIFSIFTKVKTDGTPYPLLALSGLLPWTYLSAAVTNAALALVNHTELITKVYFPREILPLTYVIAALVDFVIAAFILGCMMAYYHVAPTPLILWTIPIILLATMFATALAFLLSAIQVHFRDVGLAMPLVLQIWMFASPVVYPLSAVPMRFRSWYLLNPMAGVVESFRRAVLGQSGPEWSLLAPALIVSVLLLPLTYLIFKYVEATMADII